MKMAMRRMVSLIIFALAVEPAIADSEERGVVLDAPPPSSAHAPLQAEGAPSDAFYRRRLEAMVCFGLPPNLECSRRTSAELWGNEVPGSFVNEAQNSDGVRVALFAAPGEVGGIWYAVDGLARSSDFRKVLGGWSLKYVEFGGKDDPEYQVSFDADGAACVKDFTVGYSDEPDNALTQCGHTYFAADMIQVRAEGRAIFSFGIDLRTRQSKCDFVEPGFYGVCVVNWME